MASLQKDNVRYDIASSETREIKCVTWTTKAQLAVLISCPEVVMMDGTYKVRNLYVAAYFYGICLLSFFLFGINGTQIP